MGQRFDQKAIKEMALTLGLGAIGSAIAFWAGFPAPFLTGPAIAVTIAGLSGLSLSVPNLLRDGCFVMIGLSMGSGVTPEVLKTIEVYPFAFVILTLSLLATFFVGRLVLNHLWKLDRSSAALASSPGHLSFILGLSSQSKADIPTVSIIQSIRVMALTVVVPFAASLMGLTPMEPGVQPVSMSFTALATLVPIALLLGWGLGRLKLPAAFLLGGMVISTGAHVSGLVAGQIPPIFAMTAFMIMGSLIGTRFSNITPHQLAKAAGAGVTSMMIAVLFALLAGYIASGWLELPLAQLLIAFAPGGLEAMAAMAIIMDVDTTFVAAQHVFRLFLLTFLAPIVLAREERRQNQT